MNPPTSLDPQILKSFDVAIDLVKQLITLSTGSVALTLTFLKDTVRTLPPRTGWILRTAWLLHGFSAVCGLFAFLALAGSLGTAAAAEGIYRTNIALWVGLQFVSFGFATILIGWFGWRAFAVLPAPQPAPVPLSPAPPAQPAEEAPSVAPEAAQPVVKLSPGS